MTEKATQTLSKTTLENSEKSGYLIGGMRLLAEERADLYRVFSNDKRILIFWILMDEDMSVKAIAETVGTSMQNASQHLRLMRDKDIVRSRRSGNEVYYRVADNEIGEFCRIILPIDPYAVNGGIEKAG